MVKNGERICQMKLLAFFILLLLVTVINIILCKRIYAPPVILGAVFCASYILINIAYGEAENSYTFYGCYIIATIFFSIGFYLTANGSILSQNNVQYHIYLEDSLFKIFLGVSYIFAIIEIIQMFPYVLGAKGNIWHLIRKGYEGNALLDNGNLYIFMLVIVSAAVYMIDESIKNRKRLFLVTPCIIPFLLSTNRGTWFMFIITLLFLVIYIRRESYWEIVKIGGIAIGGIMLLILVSSVWKYKDYFDSYCDIFRMVSQSYFGSQFVAFRQRMRDIHSDHTALMMGQNTFRFIIAVGNKLGLSKEPVATVQEFVYIYGYPTNVYTGLSYYASDFGMWWAYFIEFLLGILYGYLFKKNMQKQTENIFALIAGAILMYPLINQFFDDKYFSVFSQWLQLFLYLWLFTRKKILIICNNKEENNGK